VHAGGANLGHFGVKLHASEDAGASWREVATPTYPAQPEGAAGPAWALRQLWSLESAHGIVWAGTLPGGLFRSADFGQSWQLVETLWNRPERSEWFGGGYDVPGIHSICPHPLRPGELLIGVSCGGVWLSRDGGADWRLQAAGMRAAYLPPEQSDNPNTQDPHLIARCAKVPDVLWCQHHNGIWRSTDNARSWQEVRTAPVSSFGFALAAHPQEPGTAWFVPAKADECRVPVEAALVVNRTHDGGRSFDTLRRGLPQEHCYDLVYRHGLALGGGCSDAADGQHQRQPLGQRRWRRQLAGRVTASATDLRVAFRLNRGAGARQCHPRVVCVSGCRPMSCVTHSAPQVLGSTTQSGDDRALHKLKNWCHAVLR